VQCIWGKFQSFVAKIAQFAIGYRMPGAPMFIAASRPKIHRLPALPPVVKPVRSPVLSRQKMVLGGAALTIVALIAISSQFFSDATRSEAAVKAPSPVADEKTIVLRNENQVIIGQMAHIASPPATAPEVSTASPGVDARKGQELLSIINQY
jgi:hypothetical protein